MVGSSGGGFTGVAYVFRRDGQTWVEEAKLEPWGEAPVTIFGSTVALVGRTAVVGALGDSTHANNSGAAFVYHFEEGSWERVQKLTAGEHAGPNEVFGNAVALSEDELLVASERDDSRGSVSVFRREGPAWRFWGRLQASDGQDFDRFGNSVQVTKRLAVIGARDDDDNGDRSGSAYVFKKRAGDWVEQDKLVASDGEQNDQFGYAVSLDGGVVLVGAPADGDQGFGAGATYVFSCRAGRCEETEKLVASDGIGLERLGVAVALSGSTALLGTLGEAAYLFGRALFEDDFESGDASRWSVVVP